MKHKPKAITEKAPQTTTNYETGFEILYACIIWRYGDVVQGTNNTNISQSILQRTNSTNVEKESN